MERKSASDNDISMKKEIFMLHTTYQAQKRNFGVRYNVSSAKKRIFELDTTYQALKRGFSCFRVARKDQKEVLGVTAWRGKA